MRLVGLRWPYSPRALEVSWVVFSIVNLSAMYYFAYWETIPFHFIWISITVLYGFRSWPTGPTLWILGAVMLTTASGIGLDVWRQTEPPEELTEVPLMAAVFVAMVWHAQRTHPDHDRARSRGAARRGSHLPAGPGHRYRHRRA